jgi:hypothetical protein
MAMAQERIYRTEERPLPPSIVSCDEFENLSEKQRFNYRARLRYVEEITLKIDEWLAGKETDFFSFLDTVELDLYINQGAPVGNGEDHVSAWLIHTSWTFETSVAKMLRSLQSSVRERIDAPPPGLDAPIDQFRSWIQGQNEALTTALNSYFGAESFDQAMANQLAIDALLLNVLSGVCKARLNKRLDTLRP